MFMLKIIKKIISYDELQGFLSTSTDTYINTSESLIVGIIDPLEPERDLLSFSSQTDRLEYAKGKIVMGRMPTADNEFIISLPLAESIIDGLGSEYGIWSLRHLMSEAFRMGDTNVKLVGIIKTDIQIIYMNDSLINRVNPVNIEVTLNNESQMIGRMGLSEIEILYGSLPVNQEIVISTALYQLLFGNLPSTDVFPVTINTTTQFLEDVSDASYIVSGIYESTSLTIIAPDEVVELERFNGKRSYYVYTTETIKLVDDLKHAGIQGTYDIIEKLKNDFDASVVELRVTTGVIAAIVIVFALLGFYFVMHSSMVSRIYDIAVYRALGMKKIRIDAFIFD